MAFPGYYLVGVRRNKQLRICDHARLVEQGAIGFSIKLWQCLAARRFVP
jgi:hypothetical protein